ncbi:MAG: hypothetical protein JWM80_2517 [Cyanobacteria bacterium RYN_339]|nr:hypothetical protein [Cyanobacteria bacterium RYN_339]
MLLRMNDKVLRRLILAAVAITIVGGAAVTLLEQPAGGGGANDTCAAKLLARGDQNRDGALQRDEWAKLNLFPSDKATGRFTTYDTDHDGRLIPTELVLACEALSHEP